MATAPQPKRGSPGDIPGADYPDVTDWRTGRYGSTETWARYAKRQGITYHPGVTRGRLIQIIQNWIRRRDAHQRHTPELNEARAVLTRAQQALTAIDLLPGPPDDRDPDITRIKESLTEVCGHLRQWEATPPTTQPPTRTSPRTTPPRRARNADAPEHPTPQPRR